MEGMSDLRSTTVVDIAVPEAREQIVLNYCLCGDSCIVQLKSRDGGSEKAGASISYDLKKIKEKTLARDVAFACWANSLGINPWTLASLVFKKVPKVY